MIVVCLKPFWNQIVSILLLYLFGLVDMYCLELHFPIVATDNSPTVVYSEIWFYNLWCHLQKLVFLKMCPNPFVLTVYIVVPFRSVFRNFMQFIRFVDIGKGKKYVTISLDATFRYWNVSIPFSIYFPLYSHDIRDIHQLTIKYIIKIQKSITSLIRALIYFIVFLNLLVESTKI